MLSSAIIPWLLSFVLAAWLTARFCNPASKFHILDHPNERSLHTSPTPRSGGIAILAGIIVGLAWGISGLAWPAEISWLVAALALVALVSYLDDRSGVEVRYRFAVHTGAAALLVWTGFVLQTLPLPGATWSLPLWLGASLSVLFTVWMINLYNFMDGMDGFAGGMSVIGFAAFGALGWLSGHTTFLFISLLVSSASAGFLVFNIPPARIFMGDVGSSSLGLLAAALSLWGARDGVFQFWVALLVFSPFIVDATVTLMRRSIRREKVWQAHRTHYYQRLVQLGWGHRKTVLWEYVLMLAAAGAALWAVDKPASTQWVMLGVWIALYASLAIGVRYIEERHRKHENLA